MTTDGSQVLVFTRPESDGGIVAVVRLVPLTGEGFASNLFNRLVQGVSRWVATTESGKEAWEESSQDLNIGDLSTWEGDADLTACLEAAGLADFQVIELLDHDQAYDFDTILNDPTSLPEAPSRQANP